MLKCYVKSTREDVASKYLTEEVKTVEDAIQGASYIIAERISDDAKYRQALRETMKRFGHIVTKKKKDAVDENEVFANYYEYDEAISTIKSHRILAIDRAEDKGVISASIKMDDNKNIAYIERGIIRRENTIFYNDLKAAVLDAYKRLLYPSIEREIRTELTGRNQSN